MPPFLPESVADPYNPAKSKNPLTISIDTDVLPVTQQEASHADDRRLCQAQSAFPLAFPPLAAMSRFVGFRSAFEIWRAADSRSQYPKSKALPGLSRPEKDRARMAECLANLKSYGAETAPMHFVVERPDDRSIAAGHISHVMKGIPRGFFHRLAEGLYVSSPELLAVQLAQVLGVARLSLLMYELCGSYSIDRGDSRGFRERPALTTISELASCFDKLAGVNGIKKARKALSYVCEGSASPMESKLTLMLCLPCSMGGYGIPLPVLNAKVDVSKAAQALTERKFFKCDLCWPDARLVVEYDSDAEHTAERRISEDAKKRNALEAMGYLVITVTKRQVYDANELDRIALLISRRLKRYRKSRQGMIQSRRYVLRQELLYGAPSERVAALRDELKREQALWDDAC